MCLQLLKERKKQHNETELQIASQLFLPPNLVHEAGGLLFAYRKLRKSLKGHGTDEIFIIISFMLQLRQGPWRICPA